ncbi:MAG: hypothetical protein U0Z44_03960 [Kouleothrix sp.]
MLPERVARLALAALIHDLPALVQQAGSAPPELQRVLALAAVADAAEHTLVRQAAAYAMPRSGAEPVLGRRLQPIFGLVGASAGTPPALTLPFSSLPAADQSHDRLFPTAAPGQRSLAEHLAAMLKALGQIAAEVDLANFEHSYAHLLAWLQRYGRCLPAHGDELPLCDHARLTSAIAACLAYAGADARLCLIGGALASTPGGQRQPVQLCGRGLYLAALADSFAYQLADRLGLPCGNVIMAAGRRWYVLAPAGPATAAAVAELRTELDVWLHHELAGAVTLGLAQAEFALEQLWPGSAEQAGFGALVGGLNHALEAQLLAGARGALAAADGWDEAAFVLRVHSFAGRRPCTECGRLPAGAEAGMCPACARDMALGGQLAQLGYLAHYRPDAAAGGIAAGRGWAFRALAGRPGQRRGAIPGAEAERPAHRRAGRAAGRLQAAGAVHTARRRCRARPGCHARARAPAARLPARECRSCRCAVCARAGPRCRWPRRRRANCRAEPRARSVLRKLAAPHTRQTGLPELQHARCRRR